MSLARLLLTGASRFDPRSLFGNGQVGWARWYDSPSLYGGSHPYLYQDSVGTTPVTAVGQTIGLSLDRAYGGTRGANLSAPTVSPVGGATNNGDGTFTIPANGSIRFDYTLAQLSNGMLYEFEIERVGVASTGTVTVDWCDGPQSTLTAAPAGTKSYHRGARATYDATYRFLDVGAGGSSSITFRINFARSVPGTHLTQATGTAKPTLSARVNLLLNSEDFTAASWAKITVGGVAQPSVTANQATSPRGDLTADEIGFPAVSGTQVSVLRQQVTQAVGSFAWRVWLQAKAAGDVGKKVCVYLNDGTVRGLVAHSLTLAGAWITSTGTITVANPYLSIAVLNAADGGADQAACSCYAWGADLRTADDASKNIPAYQRVGATAADHDTDGFPHAQTADGTDDSGTTATGGGNTTGFFYCGALTVSGGAGTARTIWSDTGTNTGYRVRINSSNKLELAAGNGTAYTTVASNETITAPGTYLLSAWDDGGVLAVQVNNFAPATTTRPSVSAGTSTITVYKDNGAATSYFIGRDYGSVYRQTYPGETEHNRLKAWQARRAGITV